MRLYIICLTLFLGFPDRTICQDANYWSTPYNAGGYFMAGAVVAKNGDSGVLFSNPALQAFNTKNAVSVSGTIYQWQSIKVHNGLGTGYPLQFSTGSVIPLIASNTIYLKLKKPISIAYAITHNPVMQFATSQRKDATVNVLDDSYSPGPETFIGQYAKNNSINETGGILSVGFKMADRLAWGISLEGFIRKQTLIEDYRLRAIENNGASPLEAPVVSVTQYMNYTTNFTGLRFKTGISYSFGARDHIGLTLTSPTTRIAGKATMLSDAIINNLRLSPGSTVYLLANTRQDRLPVKWKTPLSVAAGYTHDFATTQLYFAVEYFFKVKQYNILTPKDQAFVRPDTGLSVPPSQFLRLADARRSVCNVGLGISFELKPAVRGFVSLRTDFNYAEKALYSDEFVGGTAYTANWDNYHGQLGVNVRKRKFNLRAGLLFSYGHTNQYRQPLSFDNPNESNLLLGDTRLTTASMIQAGVMFAYLHNL